MTAVRYLIVVGGERRQRMRAAASLLSTHGLRTVFEAPAALVLATDPTPFVRLGDHGIVLGTLFDRSGGSAIDALPPAESDAALASHGRHLVARYWGGYVALLAPSTTTTVEVLRAPFGWLPALVVQAGRLTAIASDLALLLAADLYRPRIARDALARHLVAGDIRHDETALAGLTDLRGGDRLSLSDATRRDRVWSPWAFTADGQRLDDRAEAHAMVRDTAQHVVAARTAACGRGLLLLSGGLDSSIVAACLAQSGRDFEALTFVTDNPSGDERDHARRTADAVGIRLWVEKLRIEDVDIGYSAAAGRARPAARNFEQGIDAAIRRTATATSAETVVDGGGGDNVFCSLQSPAPVADALLAHRGPRAAWAAARDIAELADASVRTVAWRGWQRAHSRRPNQRGPDLSFLTPLAGTLAGAAIAHPWLDAPRDTLPGRTVHAGLLVPAQGLVEDHDVLAPFASHSLLVSQPLVELCLRIPSWSWIDRGRNRAAARHAFAGVLPDETLWRRSKGTPDSFLVQLLEANRPLIRNLLRDGVLAALGILDVDAVTTMLDDPRPARGHAFARVMQLTDAEVWARGFPV